MKLVLLSTIKRTNSTFRPEPDEFDITFNDVKLLAPTSVHNPSFIVRFDSSETFFRISGLNYAILDNRDYYWITDITANADSTWTVSCRIDTLATHKDEILMNNAFVVRSASSSNNMIVDTAVPTTVNDSVTVSEAASNIFTNIYTEGTYVIGIMNDDPQAVGVPHYYAMNHTQWTAFTTGMLNTVDWAGIDTSEISGQLQKALINPLQYITSAKWFPCPIVSASSVSNIPLGFWEIPASGAYRISGTYSTITFSVTLPSHPQKDQAPFANFSPYSTFKMIVEPFGEISFPAWVAGGSTISGIVEVDPCSGDGILRLTCDGTLLGEYFAPIAVDMPIGQITADFNGISKGDLVKSGLSAVSSLDNFFAVGAVERAISGVASSLTAQATAVQSLGSRGSIAAYRWPPYVMGVFKKLCTTGYNSIMGKPLCLNVPLSSLTGYTLCAYGNVQTSGSPDEREEISTFLTTGFYIE